MSHYGPLQTRSSLSSPKVVLSQKDSYQQLCRNLMDFSDRLSSNVSATSSTSRSLHFVAKKQGIKVSVLLNFLRQYVQQHPRRPALPAEASLKRQRQVGMQQADQWEGYQVDLGSLLHPTTNYNKDQHALVALLAALNRLTEYSLVARSSLDQALMNGATPDLLSSVSSAVRLSFDSSLLFLSLKRQMSVPAQQQVRSYLSGVYVRSKCVLESRVRTNLDQLYKRVLSQYPSQSTQLQQIQRLKQQFGHNKHILQQQMALSNMSSSSNEYTSPLAFRSTTRFVKNIQRRVSIQ